MPAKACPYCGAPDIGGYAGCRALMDQLNAQFGHPRAAIDCYMLQHPEIGCVSAKSYAAHLAGLCCAIEYQGSDKIHAAVQRWLNGRVDIQKPQVLCSRGNLTITHLQSASNLAEYSKLVNEWAHSVWDAYSELQPVARSYVTTALGVKNRR